MSEPLLTAHHAHQKQTLEPDEYLAWQKTLAACLEQLEAAMSAFENAFEGQIQSSFGLATTGLFTTKAQNLKWIFEAMEDGAILEEHTLGQLQHAYDIELGNLRSQYRSCHAQVLGHVGEEFTDVEFEQQCKLAEDWLGWARANNLE